MSPATMIAPTSNGALPRAAGAAAFGGAVGCAGSVPSLMLVSRRSGKRCRIVWRVPPAAAERPEERRGIGEALHVCLYLGQCGLLILLLRRQNLQLGVLAGAVLDHREVAIRSRRAERLAVCGVAVGVVLQRLQRVGHLDEGCDHRAAVGGECLAIALFRLVLSGGQAAPVE